MQAAIDLLGDATATIDGRSVRLPLAAAQMMADATGQDKLAGLVGLWQSRLAYHRDGIAEARGRLESAIEHLKRARFSSLIARARIQRAFLDAVSGRVGTAADDLGQALRILHGAGMLSFVGAVFQVGAVHCALAGDTKGAAFLRAAAESRRDRTVDWLTIQEGRDLDASATSDRVLTDDEASLAGTAASLGEAMARFRTLVSDRSPST